MRTTRVIAASAAIALSLGVGAGTASAAEVKHPCENGGQRVILPTTWTGLDKATLVKGGAPVESTITIRNTSGYDLPALRANIDLGPHDFTAKSKNYTIEVKTAGGGWKPAVGWSTNFDNEADLGTFDVAKDQTLTLQLRVSAVADAKTADFTFNLGAGTYEIDDDTGKPADYKGPATPGGKGTCSNVLYGGASTFHIAEASQSQAPSSPPAGTTATPTAKATATSTKAGPQLASTGGGDNALPLAATGAAAVALGAGMLVALRRRRGSHS